MNTSASGPRKRARTLSVCCLVIFVVLAGCSAGTFTEPSGQQEPVGLNVTNGANVTQTFEVSVVELPANVTVELPDGRTGAYETGPGLSTHDPGPYHGYTSVEPPDSARLHGRYTLKPGETNISNVSTGSLPEDFAVVVTINHNDRVISWVTATCGSDLVFVRVTSLYSTSSSVYDCG